MYMNSLSLESSVELELDEEDVYGATSGAGTADPPEHLSFPLVVSGNRVTRS
jgi:hypothetical protein